MHKEESILKCKHGEKSMKVLFITGENRPISESSTTIILNKILK